MKKLLYFITAVLCFVACEPNSPGSSTTKGEYVDLGLSSGTKWKALNEYNPNDANGFYSYEEATSLFGKNLPTKVQWMELINECKWTWSGMGSRVVGRTGNSITLPAEGVPGYSSSNVEYVGIAGYYWSSTPYDSQNSWILVIANEREEYIDMAPIEMDGGAFSVRLVK